LLAAFGVEIKPAELEWTCAHGDLHWANLTAPHLCLLDWETWGMAPAGYDPAMLYCASILRPDVINDVRATFADLLDNPSGRVAQLAAIGEAAVPRRGRRASRHRRTAAPTRSRAHRPSLTPRHDPQPGRRRD
jgi:hypothetical protein